MSTLVEPVPDTAAHHVVEAIATARAEDSVDATLRKLRGKSFDSLHYLYVLDDRDQLAGLVPFTRLMAAAGDARLGDVMNASLGAISADLDQEEAVSWARQHGVFAPPVVDSAGRLLGCLPPEALVDIGRREHAEDISRLAGIVHRNSHGVAALEAPPWRRAIHRLPWLIVGLAGSAVATLVVASFEARLSADVVVAFFIPAIVYLADAIGTQTEAVVVRGLSFTNVPRFSRLFSGEFSTGIIVGAALGVVAFLLVYAGFGDAGLALAIAIAVSLAGALASICGLLFPWLLSRFGLDPAFGSGPVATVIQDVLSLVIYFAVVQAIRPV
jgi:magnesium transporter